MKRRRLLALLLLLPAIASCEPKKAMPEEAKQPAPAPKVPEGSEVITLGAGCFWCIEAAYKQLDGVQAAVSGYMGGTVAKPTYEQICTGTTGHAEVVQVVYDPKKISSEKILAWFWDLHDPTTLNRQGADVGTQYRSAIFYNSDAQKALAEASKKAAQENFKDPIVTEITKASEFYPAENYHQDYYFQNKSKNGYCRLVIEPKLKKLKLDH
ncbi:peptide-methionine (S)-S-oxide reductase MsrA [Luteolibacter flavescens]|uniref:Peptide methionine sulfoxide reductase MsrA n=1 Tax=Luteolibacter flavescens TaxID=1859460 RepID=A0ABT3FSA3_9BACT|nr:peptide-methionine (S)-S-oxide reductase MsrA [Luteolibacter flavescens]MCW1886464.1 peptide-methionine (S)-S-oxide reductase MsrA [Luteolibacter flavescens]